MKKIVMLGLATLAACGGGGGGGSAAPAAAVQTYVAVTDANGMAIVTLADGTTRTIKVTDGVTLQPVAGDHLLIAAGPEGILVLDPIRGFHQRIVWGFFSSQEAIEFLIYNAGYPHPIAEDAPTISEFGRSQVPAPLKDKLLTFTQPFATNLPYRPFVDLFRGQDLSMEYLVDWPPALRYDCWLAWPHQYDLASFKFDPLPQGTRLSKVEDRLFSMFDAQTLFSGYYSSQYGLLIIQANQPPKNVQGNATLKVNVKARGWDGVLSPLPGARIGLTTALFGHDFSGVSDNAGDAVFNALFPGRYFLQVEKAGYFPDDLAKVYGVDLGAGFNSIEVEMRPMPDSPGRLALDIPENETVGLMIPEGQNTVSRSIRIRNEGGAPIDWQVSTGTPVASVLPSNFGQLLPHQSKILTVVADGSALAPGQVIEGLKLILFDPTPFSNMKVIRNLRIGKKGPAPVVTSTNPYTGDVSGGEPVYVYGVNFRPGAMVSFGGNLASNVQVIDSSTILCTTPAAPSGAGTVDVTVRNADATRHTLPGVFEYAAFVPDTTPPVTTANPPSGTYNGAQAITLKSDEPARLYYTVDGTTPSPSHHHGTGHTQVSLTIKKDTVLKFRSQDLKGNLEAVRTASYSIVPFNIMEAPAGLEASDGSWVGAIHVVWSSVPGAYGYRVYRSSDQVAFTMLGNVSGPSFVDANVVAGQTYGYKVASLNVAGVAGALSPIDSGFAAAAPPPTSASGAPNLISPGNGTLFSAAVSPTFQWSAVIGANGYLFHLALDPGFTSLLAAQTAASTSYALAASLGTGTYHWRVAAQTSAGTGPWSPAWTFSVAASSALPTPTVTAPLAGSSWSTSGAPPTFSWTAVSGASTYIYQEDIDPNFTSNGGNGGWFGSVGTTSASMPAWFWSTVPAGAHYFRVRAQVNGILGPWSATLSYAVTSGAGGVVVAVAAPTLSSPANGSVVDTAQPAFSWSAVAGANAYQIQVGSGASWDANQIYFQAITSATSATSTSLPIQTSAWRVRASGDGGATWSAWSAVWTFTVQPAGAPVLLSPANGANFTTYSITFSWQVVAGAPQYQFGISNTPAAFQPNAGGFSYMTVTAGTSASTWTSANFMGGANYWAVRVVYPNQYGPWSEVRQVNVP